MGGGLEGHVEGITGWSIGLHPNQGDCDEDCDISDIYEKLEFEIVPKYYEKKG